MVQPATKATKIILHIDYDQGSCGQIQLNHLRVGPYFHNAGNPRIAN
jgi:hypothetical protein